MSTTTTGAEPGGTPRRARFPRPFRRRTGTPPRRVRRAPDLTGERRVPLPVESKREERLRRTANRRGRKLAKARALDPWILASGDRVPYFAELASVRELLNARTAEEALREENRLNARGALAARAAEDAEQEVRRLDVRLMDNRDWLETNRGQLDLLAARSVRWERYRDGVRERVEERWLRARFGELDDERADGRTDDAGTRPDGTGTGLPGDGAENPGDPSGDGDRPKADERGSEGPGGPDGAGTAPLPHDDEDYQSLDQEQSRHGDPAFPDPAGPATLRTPDGLPSADPRIASHTPTDAARWEGLPARPGLPRWMVWALLLVIAAVEVPIYWIAFQPFHGTGSTESDSLSGTLAISAAIVMVIVPHLAGRALRGGAGTGSMKWANLPAIALLGVWGFSTWALGHLRTKLVFRHTAPQTNGLDNVAGLEQNTPTLIDSLHLEPTTVTWMFVALLVLSGGIGLLLGLLREHPYLEAYRSHLERGTRLERAREAAVLAAQRARAVESATTDGAELRAEATRARQRATTESYEAAAHAFLMGVAERSSDPAVTEAAMRLSNKWPLLPYPPTAPRG
ncbi:hypothetical protein ACFYUJ_26115 [Streptomyces sp. NPDC004520]|uniref:hypothetical protein n=1 Tax=Streptomyces sp. NPDC004520 TaxID=3364702 RepID=UPI003688CF9C